MKKALIHEERICEFADIGQEFPVNPGLTWVDVADDTTTQDTWNGTQVVKHVPYVPNYAELRRRAYANLGDQLDTIWKWMEAEGLVPDTSESRDLNTAAGMLGEVKLVKAAYPKGD